MLPFGAVLTPTVAQTPRPVGYFTDGGIRQPAGTITSLSTGNSRVGEDSAPVLSYLSMVTILETVLIFAVAPGAAMVVIGLLTVVPGRAKAKATYKPGDQWDYSDRFYAGSLAIAVPTHVLNSELGGARGEW